jgi:hypothetical protein
VEGACSNATCPSAARRWNTPSWDDRAPNIQEIVNATSLLFGVIAGLRSEQAWDVPTQMLLLGAIVGAMQHAVRRAPWHPPRRPW